MALLSIKGLSKRFGALVVTDNLSFDVSEGEIVGILGPNGAGKTTLFNLIAGTIRSDAGEILFNGANVAGTGVAERCRLGISRSFQVPHPFTGMSVFENVLVGATFGRSGDDRFEYAFRALDIAGLKQKANLLAGSLPLLDRKRLEMARALATEPRLLLLDEIAGGLTERECHELLSAIRDVHSAGVTIVWIEHVVHALLSVAERLVVVNFGRLIADGKPDDVMKSREVKSIYLGEDVNV
ncbi:ABC transporter ATP-binding protein [Bradyrhizobium sp. PRIMUS42]|uniref:ABC transporter ATP-binding protein n=1 Tax=Bradyrhizobium sp. PRIMUS42 TaxID=2908926 RepID=UPI001FF0F326|nr:ABC transporter ATP-binding protein [Bradyrhizobium sp. PRIMUS42]MCJ9730226.1 ABC transporter ATP-binding protein [Bradyrhizobium sp. PRIMUS42]